MRILLVDPHPLIFDAINAIVERSSTVFSVTYVPSLGECFARLSASNDVDLLLLEIALPGSNGTDALEHLNGLYPEIPILVLSALREQDYACACIAKGSMGFVSKSAGSAAIADALESVRSGAVYLESGGGATTQQNIFQVFARHFKLTARQCEVVLLIIEGLPNKDIAISLGLATNTVKVHVGAVLNALAARNRTEVVSIARKHGVYSRQRPKPRPAPY